MRRVIRSIAQHDIGWLVILFVMSMVMQASLVVGFVVQRNHYTKKINQLERIATVTVEQCAEAWLSTPYTGGIIDDEDEAIEHEKENATLH